MKSPNRLEQTNLVNEIYFSATDFGLPVLQPVKQCVCSKLTTQNSLRLSGVSLNIEKASKSSNTFLSPKEKHCRTHVWGFSVGLAVVMVVGLIVALVVVDKSVELLLDTLTFAVVATVLTVVVVSGTFVADFV